MAQARAEGSCMLSALQVRGACAFLKLRNAAGVRVGCMLRLVCAEQRQGSAGQL